MEKGSIPAESGAQVVPGEIRAVSLRAATERRSFVSKRENRVSAMLRSHARMRLQLFLRRSTLSPDALTHDMEFSMKALTRSLLSSIVGVAFVWLLMAGSGMAQTVTTGTLSGK